MEKRNVATTDRVKDSGIDEILDTVSQCIKSSKEAISSLANDISELTKQAMAEDEKEDKNNQ
jgi:hypothetical protein